MRAYNAMYARKQVNEDGKTEIVLTLPSYADELIASELQKGTAYRVSMTEVRSKRTLEQNRLLWEVIHEIAVAECGNNATSEDDWNIYIQALETANAKCEVVVVRKEAVDMLAETFRAYRVLGEVTSPNGWEMAQVKVFYGSSKMDVSEMGKLLDVVIDRAYRNGIELAYA